MSLTYGFYNAVIDNSTGKPDRTYNAEQMSQIFDGIINDGIYASIGENFAVSPYDVGLRLVIGTGRAWFNNTWTFNDDQIILPPLTADPIVQLDAQQRYYTIALQIDKTEENRKNSIVLLAGDPAVENPLPPVMVREGNIFQYRLADILVGKGNDKIWTVIPASAITSYIGSEETPFVTGILQTTNNDSIVAQWNGQFEEWLAETQETYINWYNELVTKYPNLEIVEIDT